MKHAVIHFVLKGKKNLRQFKFFKLSRINFVYNNYFNLKISEAKRLSEMVEVEKTEQVEENLHPDNDFRKLLIRLNNFLFINIFINYFM
jgi:hypothetical protein